MIVIHQYDTPKSKITLRPLLYVGLRTDTLFRETDDESLPEFSDGAIGEAEVIVEFGGYTGC